MMLITKELNPNSKSTGSWDSIVENSHNHSRKVADYLLKNKEAKNGLLKSIREDFPIKSLLSGEENMALGDLSADQQTLRDILKLFSNIQTEENYSKLVEGSSF